MALPVLSDGQVIDQLDSNRHWSGSTITYSFPTAPWLSSGEMTGFSAFGAEAREAGHLAIQLWDDLIAPDMDYRSGVSGATTNIEMAFTTTGPSYAWAYYPSHGSAFFNPAYASGTNDVVTPDIGRHGFVTYIHELGHALGLDHMGDYNGGGSWSPESYQDSTVLSVMSYFGPSWGNAHSGDIAWADWIGSNGIRYSPQTPMLNDVMAIQAMYGVETDTRTGDTVYGYNSNVTGRAADIFDFTRNAHPIVTIFDSAGNDTLDLSGWSGSLVIDIAPGGFSSGNAMTNNIAIAWTAAIENAVGAGGNDQISGNDLDNELRGNGGNDTLQGGDGDDFLDGGAGVDKLFGGNDDDTIVYDADDDWTNVDGGQGFDTLLFELVWFSVDLASYGFEQSALHLLDAAGALWSGIYEYYDTAEALTEKHTTFDNGTSSLTIYDVADEFAWAEWTRTYNASGQQTGESFVNDAAPPTQPADGDSATNAVAEDAANGATVGVTASSTDPNGDDVTYSLTDDAGGRFDIDATTGVVTVKNGALIDYETATGHTVTVRASDGISFSATTDIAIAVTDVGVEINGTAGQDHVDGASTVSGQALPTSQEDTIRGFGEDDDLNGLDGDDILDGGDGNDRLVGAVNGDRAGADTLIGGADDDTIYADPGDTVRGGPGTDTLIVRAGAEGTAPGTPGITILLDNANADVEDVWGGPNDDVIDGSAVNGERLTLRGGGGGDTVTGGNYRDSIFGGDGNDDIFGGAENDILRGEGGEDEIHGQDGEDQLRGGDDADILHGGGHKDVLDGDAGDDTLNGDGGNDRLYGATATSANGADTLNGGDGDDKIYADSSDTVNGGNGHDQLVARVDGLTVDLAAASIEETWGGGFADVFDGSGVTSEVLKLRGGGGADTLTGGALADRLYGGSGGDLLIGGGGGDYLKGEGGIDDLRGGAGDDTLRGGAEGDTLSGGADDDHLDGNGGDDTLNGDGGGDTLVGALEGSAEGADTLNGGDDDDRIYADGSDTVDGGAGYDVLVIRDTLDTIFLLDDADVEEVWGGDGGDTLDGSGVTSDQLTLRGRGGEDVLTGGDLADVLYGGADDDVLSGGGGIDTLAGDGGADDFVTTAFDGATDIVTDYSFAEGDRVSGVSCDFDGTDTHVYDGVGNELFTLAGYDADTDGIAFL